MYIKSTNENLNTMDQVYDSLYNHLGFEYMVEVKQIFEKSVLETEEYNHLDKAFEEAEDEWLSEKKRYLNRHADARQAVFDFIHTIEEAPRLNRKKIIEKLKNIANIY